MSFRGYTRKAATGVRNFVAIIPTVGCANEMALSIADNVQGAMPFLHHEGCTRLSFDLETVKEVLIGMAKHPNVASTLLVSLGCESIKAEQIIDSVKPVKSIEMVRFQELGGSSEVVSKGTDIAKQLVDKAKRERSRAKLSDLTIGIKCGASDATSGIASNPATGAAVDRLIEEGTTVIFGETTEILGAEHILARRAENEEVEEKIFEIVEDMEKRVEHFGVDMRGGQPTEGNIRGGLTTIEDKSLGAIVKSGSKPIQGVLEYGEEPPDSGLYIMDSPGREMEFLTGVAAGGAQIILFSTGLGAPQGFPIAPVIKISGNKNTCQNLAEHIDLDVSSIIAGEESIEEAGDKIFESVLQVASGEKVKAETLGYDEHGVNSNIYTKGPVI